MGKVICIIQARLGSTRLPNKIIKKIGHRTVIELVINRVKLIKNIDEIIIATTTNKNDDLLVKYLEELNIKYFRGAEQDVLERYYLAARKYNADTIVRVTSDCPFLDYKISEEIINFYLSNNEYDYVSNTIDRTYPRGLDTEVFSFSALETAYVEAKEKFQREHVTPYIWGNNRRFNIYSYKSSVDNSDLRITLDTEEDLKLIRIINDKLSHDEYFLLNDILKLVKKYPMIKEINKDIEQKKIDDISW